MNSVRSRLMLGSGVLLASAAIATAAVLGATATAAPVAPSVTTGSAVAVSTTAETLLGTVNPSGTATRYYFQYGTTTAYGSATPSQDAGSGASPVDEAASLSGVTPGTVYHYRIVAVSAGGTVDGADETFTAGGVSSVHVLGREGFVSPGDVIGIQIGCFGGVTTCAGTFTVTSGSTLVGSHTYSIAPNSGGFHNFKLTSAGDALLSHNKVNDLLGVTVTVNENDGQKVQFTVHLARWFWHS